MTKRVYDTNEVNVSDLELKEIIGIEDICDLIGLFVSSRHAKDILKSVINRFNEALSKIESLDKDGYDVLIVNEHICVINKYNQSVVLLAEKY